MSEALAAAEVEAPSLIMVPPEVEALGDAGALAAEVATPVEVEATAAGAVSGGRTKSCTLLEPL